MRLDDEEPLTIGRSMPGHARLLDDRLSLKVTV
jgi:hypothetical protein